MSFQITLLLTSFVYLDVINQQIPVFQNFEHTPMILIFFVTVLVIQVALIVGTVLQIEPVSDIQYVTYSIYSIVYAV